MVKISRLQTQRPADRVERSILTQHLPNRAPVPCGISDPAFVTANGVEIDHVVVFLRLRTMTAYMPKGAFKPVMFLGIGFDGAVKVKDAGLADVYVKPEQ